MPKVSIIIPVYKVEKYIVRCIDSILAQTYSDWELLLVDDGSPDQSGVICDEYVAKDSRIRVFHKENSGVSAARNYARDRALGEYITFVDSDDWLDSECLDMCVNEIESNSLDLLQFGYREVSSDGNILKVKDLGTSKIGLNDYLKTSFLVTVWGSVFKTSLIKDHSIRFNTNLKLAEDQLFVMQYMIVSQTFKSITGVYYNYFINQEGAVKNSKSEDMIMTLNTLDPFVRKNPIFESVCFPLFDNFLALMLQNGDVCVSNYIFLYKKFYKNRQPNYILNKYSKLSVISDHLAYIVCYIAYSLRYKFRKFRR